METALLAIPETCADKIITLYHSSLFAGHQGVIKMYSTIGDKFFITGLIPYLIKSVAPYNHQWYRQNKV